MTSSEVKRKKFSSLYGKPLFEPEEERKLSNGEPLRVQVERESKIFNDFIENTKKPSGRGSGLQINTDVDVDLANENIKDAYKRSAEIERNSRKTQQYESVTWRPDRESAQRSTGGSNKKLSEAERLSAAAGRAQTQKYDSVTWRPDCPPTPVYASQFDLQNARGSQATVATDYAHTTPPKRDTSSRIIVD